LYQSQCNHIFGDGMCQFDRTTLQSTVTALSGSDQNKILTGLTPSPTTLYNQGTIVSTSGANSGFSRNIGSMSSGVVYFLKPWIYPVMVGDGFTLLPGCDHTVPTCTTVFNNLIHYGGFPYIPPPELAI
jgi:uncharacterized phage protein (TIGR02218 family)